MLSNSPQLCREPTGTLTAASETEAMEQLHRVHRPVLLAYVTRLTKGDVHWAEDILQETIVKAWKNPKARNAEGRWNRSWLFRVARRITIDHVRAAVARPPEHIIDDIDWFPATDDSLDRALDAEEVRAALSSLPERLRTVLVVIYFLERSTAEAAELLNVPKGTVKSRTFYALRALQDALSVRGFTFREPLPANTSEAPGPDMDLPGASDDDVLKAGR
ncbi:sigma-70 family RNA polymerase sigma factor [Actinoplanes sp. NPDC051470]|uniref:sigma-70 family RNA polymerase sigma factor n=1 Tax=Actinoplanes sp. NPDC051470 TaxID=3157224 RepID=UPI0034323A17